MSPLPRGPVRALPTPAPRWRIGADVVVVGSGIAGLSTALRYVRVHPAGRVLLVTKNSVANGATRWAQGGIAAAVAATDSPLAHMVDTMVAGRELSSPRAVRALVHGGPAALRWLADLGTAFDTDDGAIALTREGGHRHPRIAHAGGDATGAEIERALVAAVRAEPRIEVMEHATVANLLLTPDPAMPGSTDAPRRVCGLTVHAPDAGRDGALGAVSARAVVLATGGLGQAFAATTNPAVSTGDGVALGLRAGAHVRDLEFIQFHPTVLWLGDRARGQQPLISEAVRGEGAVLVDTEGRRFMADRHELADLAPRDVVARGIAAAMADTGAPHVYLDATHFGAHTWEHRFPTILASCRAHGIDPVHGLIPVSPAAHYASGGLYTDLAARTDIAGLYAVGEVACTGVHGANRLASNSLLESVVFAHRAAEDLAATASPALSDTTPAPRGPMEGESGGAVVAADAVPRIRAIMSRHAGVLRDPDDLDAALKELTEIASAGAAATLPATPETWQATNLLTVATAVIRAARVRARMTERPAEQLAEQQTDTRTGQPAGQLAEQLAEQQTDTRTGGQHAVGRTTDAGRRHVAVNLDGETVVTETARLWERTAVDGADAVGEERDAEETPGDPETTRVVAAALREDLGERGDAADVTSLATIPAAQIGTADMVAREAGVVAGLDVAELVFHQVCEGMLTVERHVVDGAEVTPGTRLLSVTARTRSLLTAERTALNFVTHLSGIATATRAWVRAVAGTGAQIRDTRKTHPGLRRLEKHAVRCGGGVNHRMGLHDAALIKDNHVAAAGGVAPAIAAVRAAAPEVPLEVEVDDIAQIEPALAAGATEILLDNFTVAELRRAVDLVRGRALLEASGGLGLDTARDVARTGVDFLAVGALTHSSPALDIALDLRDGDGT